MDCEGIPDWMATCKDSLQVQTARKRAEQTTVKQCLTVQPGIPQRVHRQLESGQPVGDFDRAVEKDRQLGAPRPKRVRKEEKA